MNSMRGQVDEREGEGQICACHSPVLKGLFCACRAEMFLPEGGFPIADTVLYACIVVFIRAGF